MEDPYPMWLIAAILLLVTFIILSIYVDSVLGIGAVYIMIIYTSTMLLRILVHQYYPQEHFKPII